MTPQLGNLTQMGIFGILIKSMNPNLIICAFCGNQADIVKQDDSTLVKCGHCDKETKLGAYKEMFNQWIDEKRKRMHES